MTLKLNIQTLIHEQAWVMLGKAVHSVVIQRLKNLSFLKGHIWLSLLVCFTGLFK